MARDGMAANARRIISFLKLSNYSFVYCENNGNVLSFGIARMMNYLAVSGYVLGFGNCLAR